MPQFTFNPLSDPGQADAMIAGGVVSPGVMLLMSGGDREYNWDIKQAPGTQGYTMTYRGWKVGEPIVCRFVFFDHKEGPGYTTSNSGVQSFYDIWVPIWAIDARKGPNSNVTSLTAAGSIASASKRFPPPVGIYHPILNANDINALLCKRIGALRTDGKMLWWIDMEFLEYRPPKIIPPATPKGATAPLAKEPPVNKIEQQIVEQETLAARPVP